MPEEIPQEAQVSAKRPPGPKDKVAWALVYCIIAGVIVETSAARSPSFGWVKIPPRH